MASSRAKEAALTSNNASCMQRTIVGGLQTEPKFVEKESTGSHLAKVGTAPDAGTAFASRPDVERPNSFISSATSRVSPPSVEKYVLTASFLI
jgi:hypothetical protein